MPEVKAPKPETEREQLERLQKKLSAEVEPTTGTVEYTGATKVEVGSRNYRLLLVPVETWVKLVVGFVIGAVATMTTTLLSIAPERSILVNKIVPNEQGLATIDPITKQKLPLGRVLSEQGVLQINTWTLLNAIAQQCFQAQNAPVAPQQPPMIEAPPTQ